MRRRNFENFPTTKSSCGTRWGKKREEWLYPCLEDGRRMMRRTPKKQNKTKKQKKNHDNKIKPTPVQPRPRPPKIKILSNPAAGPKSIQKRDVHMCITGEKQTKQNATEKRTPCHATVHTTGSGGQGMRIWISVSTWWNVRYVWVCMTTYVATIWGEGTVFFLSTKLLITRFLFKLFFETTWGFEVEAVRADENENCVRSISVISQLRKQTRAYR